MRLALALLALLAAAALAAAALPSPFAAEPPPPAPGGVAVVELFTSQGCSSCPPADDVLAAIGDEPGVVALAWHVDYWDRLGWPDPFAAPAHTRRQAIYAEALGDASLYTPQIVVNGAAGFVGSDARKARAAIAAARARPAAARLTARVERDGRRWTVHPKLTGAPPDAVILAALAESGLAVEVKRGENAGRTLRHDHVVRAFATGGAGKPITLTAPAELDPKRARVVVLARAADGVTLIAGAIASAEALSASGR